MSNEMKPHPKLGVNFRRAIELCGICGTEYNSGLVPMGIQNFKYQCPECGLVHYGEPRTNKGGSYECQSCGQSDQSFKMIELKEGEPVKTGVGCCGECTGKLDKTKVALIEIKNDSQMERTGRVFFVEPKSKLKKALEGSEARSVYVEEAMIKKMGLK